MANLIQRANLNLAAGNFNAVEAGANSFINSEAGTTDTTTSYVYDTACTITNLDVMNGIALLLQRLGTTGTFSVALSDDAGVSATREVTVNCSDLPTERSWVFFKFGSTLTGDGGADYRVGIKSSTATQVRVYGDGSRRSRAIALDATAVAGAADVLFIVGEWTGAGAGSDFTVTMDQTAATDYGAIIIGQRGILNWGTTAATNYLLRTSGIMKIFSGGSYRQGTVATPIPRNSTAILEFDCASATEFGMEVYGGDVVVQGLSRASGKNVISCKLNTDEAAAQTVLGVDTDTGWLSGDEIGIGSTTRTSSERELEALSGDAAATTITIAAGLSFAHSGTSPTQAEIYLLTRNCKIRATNVSFPTYILFDRTCTFDIDWCEFRFLGANTANERGIQFGDSNTFLGTGSIKFFSFRDSRMIGWFGASVNNVTLEDFVCYDCLSQFLQGVIYVNNGTSGLNNIIRRGCVLGFHASADSYAFRFEDNNFTLEDLTVSSWGAANGAIFMAEATSVASGIPWLIDGLDIHSCGSVGLVFNSNRTGFGTFRDFRIWRNTSYGCYVNQAVLFDMVFEDGIFFGNGTRNFLVFGVAAIYGCLFKDVDMSGDSTFGTPIGVEVTGNGATAAATSWRFLNCNLGVASGIFVAHSTCDILFSFSVSVATWTLINTKLGSAVEIDDYDLFLTNDSYVVSMNHDQSVAHKGWLRNGLVQYDTSIFPFGQKLTPTSASWKIDTSIRIPGRGFLVPVDSGQAATITAQVQKDGSYNGNQPRLVARANPAIGIMNDTVLDTMTVGASTTEVLSGATIAVTAKGVVEAFVDVDGTAGNAFVGAFNAS